MSMSLILLNSGRRLLRVAAASLLLASASAPAADLVEYYHAELDHYFVTRFPAEIEALDSGKYAGWARTGLTIPAFDSATGAGANSIPVCRFYGNPKRGLDSHFYSASKAECEAVQQKWPDDWILESAEAFRVNPLDPVTGQCTAGTKAVYRLYNKRADINHRYTTDPAVFDSMLAKGYAAEGNGSPKPVVFCAPAQSNAQPAAGLPMCAVTASSAFPVPNMPVTLTATCTENPTSYSWINCTSTTSSCVVNATATGVASYGVVGVNSRGSSAPANITLNWQAAASAGPSCTVSASSATPVLGSKLTLSSSCSHSPAKYQWQSCSALLIEACNAVTECASSTSTCSPVGTQAGPIYYALVATNSAGASNKVGVSVDWRSSSVVAPPTSSPPTTPPPSSTPTPSCTLAASTTTPAVNATLTLTATCNNAPTSYQWVNCTAVPGTNRCTVSEQTAVTRIYRVQGINANGVGVPSEITIPWQTPVTAPPVCTLTPSTTTPYLGGTVTLTANCSQSPASYAWTNCNGSGRSCQASASSLGQVSYSVTATNSFGASAPAQTSVTWTTPPPAGADFCSQYPQVARVTLNWGGYIDTNRLGGFPAGAILVGRLTVPQNAKGTGPGLVSMAEYIDGQADRIMTISTSSCDFRGFKPGQFPTSDPTGATRPMAWSFSNNPSIQFGLMGSAGNQPKLVPGQTYYVNIRNRDYSGEESCKTTTCNVRLTVNSPR